MTKVNVTKTINVSADSAWNKISSFRGIENFSPIEKSITEGEGVGAKRSCFMPDQSEIKETLTKLDNENMHLEYVILSGPFPITDYVSNVLVKSKGANTCEVSWSSEFNTEVEAEMIPLFEGFYNAIMTGLESVINSEAEMV